MKMKHILTIAKKELKSQAVNPTTYIISGVFLAVWEFLFFQNVFLIGEASLQSLFNLLPWFFLLLIPAITMASIAEENNNETLEILLTHPLEDRELILGKFLSSVTYVAILLLSSLPIALSLNAFGDMDFGVFVGQYVASLLLAFPLMGLGIAVSTYFRSQVPALMLSVVSTFVLIIIGSEIVTISLPSWLGTLFSRLSVLPHFNSLARGVIDIRDVWYFGLLTALFLELGCLHLMMRRTSKRSAKIVRERGVVFALGAVLVMTSGFALFPTVRIDLTEGNIYTLTKATKDVLGDVSGDITITLYESANLPAQLQPVARTVKDVLRDYKTYGGSKVTVAYKDPDSDQAVAQEAQQNGVRPAQFNVVGNGEFQVKQSYFGLTVASGGETRVIPLIQDTSDLEYQLTSFVYELTATDKKHVVFLGTPGAEGETQYGSVVTELKKQFTVESFTPSEATSTVPEGTGVLVVAGPTGMFDKLVGGAIRDALSRNISVLFMVDALEVNTQYMIALANGTSTDDVLKEYGVTVNTDLVYDLRANQMVRASGNGVAYLTSYPAYIRSSIAEGIFPGLNIQGVTIPWGSSLTVDGGVVASKGLESTPLLYTTQYAGVQTGEFSIQPSDEAFPSTNLSQRMLAVLLKPTETLDGGESVQGPRIVAVGDSDFLTDAYGQAENIAFGMELVSYLAQEGSLAGIKIKQNTPRPLTFENPVDRTWVQYGNMGGILLLLIVVGAVVIVRRRGLRTLTYKEGKNR